MTGEEVHISHRLWSVYGDMPSWSEDDFETDFLNNVGWIY